MDEPTSHVRFPPGRLNVLVPRSPFSAMSIGMSMYSASRPRAVLAARGLWAAAALTAGRAVPGERTNWTPPIPPATYDELWSQWRSSVGRRPDGVAVYERPQAHRDGLTLIVCAGRDSMLVRIRTDAADLAREAASSARAQQLGLRSISVPRQLGAGSVDEWHWTGYEVIALRPHRPVFRLDDEGYAEIEAVAASGPRPDGVPAHWTGAHGDLTPWNLRHGRGRRWLIDWEDSGWLPPQADRTYLGAVVAALRPGRVRPLEATVSNAESRRHWADVVSARPADPTEAELKRRMLHALGADGA